MTLIDSGVLFSLVDTHQPTHLQCRAQFNKLLSPSITTWLCFTEAMYFAHRSAGWYRQKFLWNLVEGGKLIFHSISDSEMMEIRTLMERYHDIPMDIADASLVVTAHTLNIRTIFTLDSDFYIYRFRDNGTFNVIP